MNTPFARKKLPVNPSLEHLQKQAKRRVKQNPLLQLAAAQQHLAKEYGCKNWAELAQVVGSMSRRPDLLVNDEKRYAPMPNAARAGDLEQVRHILHEGTFTQHDLDQSLAHALWYGDESTWPARKALADLLLDHGADPDGQYGSGGYGPIVFGTGECIQSDGLQYLVDAGADVTFPPVPTKYGSQCPLSQILGTYLRGRNDCKHRYIEILLQHGAQMPPEVTPPILAIHRGAARQLGELLDRDPGLLHKTFSNLPYGNLALGGATLLHCAVEFGEIECLDELLKRGADLNCKAEIIDGIGGQTPVFHAIATNGDDNFYTLAHLAKHQGHRVDPAGRATWRRHGAVQPRPMTPVEFAEHAARTEDAQWRKKIPEELAILRSLG
jgi:ankyrin repeat protein